MEMLSPRLRWMREHRVATLHHSNVAPGDECPETGDRLYPWCASDMGFGIGPQMAFGDTEEEALACLALKRGWKLWNEI